MTFLSGKLLLWKRRPSSSRTTWPIWNPNSRPDQRALIKKMHWLAVSRKLKRHWSGRSKVTNCAKRFAFLAIVFFRGLQKVLSISIIFLWVDAKNLKASIWWLCLCRSKILVSWTNLRRDDFRWWILTLVFSLKTHLLKTIKPYLKYILEPFFIKNLICLITTVGTWLILKSDQFFKA